MRVWLVDWAVSNFAVVCSVPWPLNKNKASGDFVLLQTLLLFMCKSWYSLACDQAASAVGEKVQWEKISAREASPAVV